MTEPTVDFDIEEVERRLGAAPSRDVIRELERAAVERGARAFASLVLFSTTPVYRERWRRAAQARVMIAVYLLRMPGHEALYSLTHIGRLCGVTKQGIHRMATSVRQKLGLPPKISTTHRKKPNA